MIPRLGTTTAQVPATVQQPAQAQGPAWQAPAQAAGPVAYSANAAAQGGSPAIVGGIAGAQPRVGGNYIPVGEHVLSVEQVKTYQKYLIVEFNVLASTVPNLPPGTVWSLSMEMGHQYMYGEREAKSLFSALLGADPGNLGQVQALEGQGAFSQQCFAEMMAPNQPMRGSKVKCSAWAKATRGGPTPTNKSGTVTRYSWMPVQ